MSKAISVDLRDRVIAAIEGGMACRQAAARFGVSAASAISWRSRLRRQGDVRPRPLGGDRGFGRIEGHADVTLGLIERKIDITPGRASDGSGRTGRGNQPVEAVAVLRASQDNAQKKSAHADEQSHPEVLSRRQARFDGQLDPDPERLVFIAATGARNAARG